MILIMYPLSAVLKQVTSLLLMRRLNHKENKHVLCYLQNVIEYVKQ